MGITGKDLIKMGFEPGDWFVGALEAANTQGLEGDALRAFVTAHALAPKLPFYDQSAAYALNIEAESAEEEANIAAVARSMDTLMRTPTLVGGAVVMPDACPAGLEGTIPVGGDAIARNAIHSGMHSADICCSVMMTEFSQAEPKAVLYMIHQVTHFGPDGRRNGEWFTLSPRLLDAFRDNDFLRDAKSVQAAQEHLGTQGDGNHFAFVGTSSATGRTSLVTHHGSHGPGAGLYKLGMCAAEKVRRKRSPDTLKGNNAWLVADSTDGRAYWEALQIIRKWTKVNHNGLNQAVVERLRGGIERRIWNEHNFVFRKEDLYDHVKGATPVDEAFLPDSDGMQIVPLNMAEPIFLVKGGTTARNHGFAPHDAGRNFSRTAHKRNLAGRTDEEIFATKIAGSTPAFSVKKSIFPSGQALIRPPTASGRKWLGLILPMWWMRLCHMAPSWPVIGNLTPRRSARRGQNTQHNNISGDRVCVA